MKENHDVPESADRGMADVAIRSIPDGLLVLYDRLLKLLRRFFHIDWYMMVWRRALKKLLDSLA